MNKNYILYVLPIVVFIINRIPYIGKYLCVVNTLIHESRHAIAALATSGEVYTVELFSDISCISEFDRGKTSSNLFQR